MRVSTVCRACCKISCRCRFLFFLFFLLGVPDVSTFTEDTQAEDSPHLASLHSVADPPVEQDSILVTCRSPIVEDIQVGDTAILVTRFPFVEDTQLGDTAILVTRFPCVEGGRAVVMVLLIREEDSSVGVARIPDAEHIRVRMIINLGSEDTKKALCLHIRLSQRLLCLRIIEQYFI